MFNLLKIFRKEKIIKNKIWNLDGGIHLPEMKMQSSCIPLRKLPLADHFIIPLRQHIILKDELCVKPGDYVLRGQPLTIGIGSILPVHAPTSGIIEKIDTYMITHPDYKRYAIFISPDGKDQWIKKNSIKDFYQLTRTEIIKRIHQAGIVGLGGANFPTATKLIDGLNNNCTLIINAAECEPYITADDRLIQECADETIEGIRILAWILQAKKVSIGIENNKSEAIAALRRSLNGTNDIQLRIIPTKYPSGGEKQLIKILTGKEIPSGHRSSNIGILVQNIGTAYSVKRAIIDGEPLTERVVTLTGKAVAKPGNVWGRFGTPVSHLLKQVGFQKQLKSVVIMGGPMMGFILPTLDIPIVKSTNCLLAALDDELGEPQPELSCIRCGICASVCPINLLPQQLYWYSKSDIHNNMIRSYHINDCIECGACSWVCPSNIPLVYYFRKKKLELRAIDLAEKRSIKAKLRFEARKTRLEKEKQKFKTYYTLSEYPDIINTNNSILSTSSFKETHVTLECKDQSKRKSKIEFSPQKMRDLRRIEVKAAIARAKEKRKNKIINNNGLYK